MATQIAPSTPTSSPLPWEDKGHQRFFILLRLFSKGLSTYGVAPRQASVELEKLWNSDSPPPCNEDFITLSASTSAAQASSSTSITSAAASEDTTSSSVSNNQVLIPAAVALTRARLLAGQDHLQIEGLSFTQLQAKLARHDRYPGFIRLLIRLFTSIEKQRSLLIYCQAKLCVGNLITLLTPAAQNDREIVSETDFDRSLQTFAPLAQQWLTQLSTRSRLYPWIVCLYVLSKKPLQKSNPAQFAVSVSDFSKNGKYYPRLKQAGSFEDWLTYGFWGQVEILPLFEQLGLIPREPSAYPAPPLPHQRDTTRHVDANWQQCLVQWQQNLVQPRKKEEGLLEGYWRQDQQDLEKAYRTSQAYLDAQLLQTEQGKNEFFDETVKSLFSQWEKSIRQLRTHYHPDFFHRSSAEERQTVTSFSQDCNAITESYHKALEQYAEDLKTVRDCIEQVPRESRSAQRAETFLDSAEENPIGEEEKRIQEQQKQRRRQGIHCRLASDSYDLLYREELGWERKGWRKREETPQVQSIENIRQLRKQIAINDKNIKIQQERALAAEARAETERKEKEAERKEKEAERKEKEAANKLLEEVMEYSQSGQTLPDSLLQKIASSTQKTSARAASSSHDAEGDRRAQQTAAQALPKQPAAAASASSSTGGTATNPNRLHQPAQQQQQQQQQIPKKPAAAHSTSFLKDLFEYGLTFFFDEKPAAAAPSASSSTGAGAAINPHSFHQPARQQQQRQQQKKPSKPSSRWPL